MPTYKRSDAATNEIIHTVLERYHGGLLDADLIIDTLMVFCVTDEDGDSTGPALKKYGYKCAAMIRILGLKDRVARSVDVELLIDGYEWEVLDDVQREALIDHELTHLALQIDDKGQVIRDDADRPKLQMRKHDHQFGWFDATARRYGEHSPEVRQCRALMEADDFRQLYLFEEVEA